MAKPPATHQDYRTKAPTSLAQSLKNDLGVDIDPEESDKVQRFPAPGKSATNKAIWLHYPFNANYASYGSHITGEKFRWKSDNSENLTIEEKSAWKAKSIERAISNQNERFEVQKKAAETASSTVGVAEQAKPTHPYLEMKKVKPHGLRQIGRKLIVPMYNGTKGVCNLQWIDADGSKRFLKGGRIKGSYAKVGALLSTERLYICEGWATAASIHEETGHPAIAAMNAGNLLDVCVAIASVTPGSIEIIVAADNDHRTEGNPGLTKGTQAAKAIGASYVTPPLPCSHKDCCCTDFNDFTHCGNRLKVDI